MRLRSAVVIACHLSPPIVAGDGDFLEQRFNLFLNLVIFEQYLRAALCPTSGCLTVLNIPSFSDDYAVRTNQPLTTVLFWVVGLTYV